MSSHSLPGGAHSIPVPNTVDVDVDMDVGVATSSRASLVNSGGAGEPQDTGGEERSGTRVGGGPGCS